MGVLVAPPRRAVIRGRSVTPAPTAAESSRTEPDWTGLLRRASGGDHDALAEFYDRTSHLVYGLALRILGHREAAEDTVIEVYAQAWRDAKTYDPQRGTPCSWLLNLTRSRAIDLLRARKRERANDPLESAYEVHAATPDPEEATADAERHRFVRSALTRLSGEQREAIELAYFRGLSHTEIADQLGQPLGTVKTRIRLGMMRMRELLGHMGSPLLTAGGDST